MVWRKAPREPKHYEEDGTRGRPQQVGEAVFYADRVKRFAAQGGALTYKLSNLNIHTLTSFSTLLRNLNSPTGLMLDRIFARHHYEG